MRVVLVRHGTDMWHSEGRVSGWSSAGLSDAGRQAITALAAVVRAWPLDAIYTSDLARATQSAALFRAAVPAVPFIADAAWRGAHMGAWTGHTWAEVLDTNQHDQKEDATQVVPPQGESRRMVGTRVIAGMERLHHAHSAAATVLVVTHATPIQMLLCHWFNLSPALYWRWRIDPATLTSLDFYDSGAILEYLNWHPHSNLSPFSSAQSLPVEQG